MERIEEYLLKENERFLSELFTFLRFKSISNISEYNEDVRECSQWLKDHIKSIGIKECRLYQTEGHPILYAEWLEAGKNAPTVLIYGHYDVQPVDPIEEWHSDPFEPHIENGKIWGRGTADDKGQLFVHLKAIEAFFKTEGRLPINVKLVIEGEEEANSNHLEDFIKTHADMLKCDVVLISDTEWFANGLPTICYALRGIAYFEIKVTGPNRDVHSGTYGGGIRNPINTLCEIIAQLKDQDGRINVPGVYDSVLPLSEEEKAGFVRLPFNEKAYCEDLGIETVYGEEGYTTLERVWARPSLDLNGIIGGYTGEGSKTVLPSSAKAKLSIRLVPNQDPNDIAVKFEEHLRSIIPPGVKLEFNALHGGMPVLTPRNSKGIKACMTAFKSAFGRESVFMREGGSIPIVEVFQRELDASIVLMGLGLPGDNIHSPNENFDLQHFYGGIKASAIFIEEMTK